MTPLEFHNAADCRKCPTWRGRGGPRRRKESGICSYKNAKANAMLSSAKARTVPLTHQHAASKLYSLFQTEAVIRSPKRGYPAETQLVLIWNKHNAIKGQAAIPSHTNYILSAECIFNGKKKHNPPPCLVLSSRSST